jgi:predicted transcriptional regulator
MASMWDPAGRRSSVQIIGDMLDIIRLDEPTKTSIMNKVCMSYAQMQRYLGWLIKSGMLDVVISGDNAVSYRITNKGLKLLSALESLREMLRRKGPNLESDLLARRAEIKSDC